MTRYVVTIVPNTYIGYGLLLWVPCLNKAEAEATLIEAKNRYPDCQVGLRSFDGD